MKIIERTATFSPCRTWRYSLLRRWSPGDYAMFIGLNPSTADETQDDPTVRRCIRYAQDWGYAALYMTNIFAFRATDPKVMRRFDDPIGPKNDTALIRLAAGAGIVIAAWGVHGEHLGRGDAVRRFLQLKAQVEADKARTAATEAELAALQPQPTKMANPSTPKYRDPAKPENTWAGRGKQPGWLKEKLEAGASLDDFLVDKPPAPSSPDDPGF